MRLALALALVLAAPALIAGPLPRTAAPAGAKVYFIGTDDGDTLTNPVTIRFGLSGMGVAPAGTVKENTGHHHLLIDVAELPAADMPLPNLKFLPYLRLNPPKNDGGSMACGWLLRLSCYRL